MLYKISLIIVTFFCFAASSVYYNTDKLAAIYWLLFAGISLYVSRKNYEDHEKNS